MAVWPPDASRHTNGKRGGAASGLVAPQKDREQVAHQVVDADERLARRPREPLGRLHADEQRADEARPIRDRDAVDVSASATPARRSASRTTGPTLRR